MAENGNGGNGNGGHDSATFGFLTRKLGPLPVWAWGAIIVAAYYWYTHYGPGAQNQQGQTPVATESVVSSGGPSVTTTHITHDKGGNGGHERHHHHKRDGGGGHHGK
jgi:hypothetical protein